MLIQNLSKIDFQDKNLIDNILNLLIIHLLPLVIDDRETVTTDFLWCFLDVEGVRDRHRPGVFPFFLLVSSLFVEADRFYSSDLPFLLNRSPTMFRTGSKSGFSCARLSPSQSCATAVRASARRPPPLVSRSGVSLFAPIIKPSPEQALRRKPERSAMPSHMVAGAQGRYGAVLFFGTKNPSA